MFKRDKAFENLSSLISKLESEPEKPHKIELVTHDGQKLIYVLSFSTKLKKSLKIVKNEYEDDD